MRFFAYLFFLEKKRILYNRFKIKSGNYKCTSKTKKKKSSFKKLRNARSKRAPGSQPQILKFPQLQIFKSPNPFIFVPNFEK